MICRGDVYWVNLDDVYKQVEGTHHQRGKRPCVVVSNNKNNRNSSIITVVPLTTKRDNLPQHKSIILENKRNYVLPEHIISISKSDLLSKFGRLDNRKFIQVEKSIMIQLGLYGRRRHDK